MYWLRNKLTLPSECEPGQFCATSRLNSTSGDCLAGYYCLRTAVTATPTDGNITGKVMSADLCLLNYHYFWKQFLNFYLLFFNCDILWQIFFFNVHYYIIRMCFNCVIIISEDIKHKISHINQGCQFWPPIRPDWHQMGQIWDFLRSVFCSFWLGEQNTDL